MSGAPIEQVKRWLLDYQRKAAGPGRAPLDDLDPHLDLIEHRVIDSLGFMEFVFFLEDVAGRELAQEMRNPDNFRSLHIIEEKILGGRP